MKRRLLLYVSTTLAVLNGRRLGKEVGSDVLEAYSAGTENTLK